MFIGNNKHASVPETGDGLFATTFPVQQGSFVELMTSEIVLAPPDTPGALVESKPCESCAWKAALVLALETHHRDA